MAVKVKDPVAIFYDIETQLLPMWTFSLGKQVISHNQLMNPTSLPDIICITYVFNDGKPAKVLRWDPLKGENSSKIIKEFDEIVKKADVSIGQNSDAFDVKHINTQRFMHGLPPFPDWAVCTDDTLKQLQRYFYLPSNKLDYVSTLLGMGGKDKIELSDWKRIAEYIPICKLIHQHNKEAAKYVAPIFFGRSLPSVLREGKKSLNKMCDYGKKDTEDTRKLWYKIAPYCKPKLNLATFYGHQDGNYLKCRHCGGDDIYKNGTDNRGATLRQKFYCRSCKRQAGSATISKKGTLGKIG